MTESIVADAPTVVLDRAAVQAGMYVQHPHNSAFSLFVISTGGRWTVVQLRAGLAPSVLTQFDPAISNSYLVLAQPPLLAELCQALAGSDPTAVSRATRAERDRWQQFADRMREHADEGDLDRDAWDEDCDTFSNLDLAKFEQSYNVTFNITGTVTMSVTARDEDDAIEAARDAMAIREGDTHTLHGESFLVTEESFDEAEVVD